MRGGRNFFWKKDCGVFFGRYNFSVESFAPFEICSYWIFVGRADFEFRSEMSDVSDWSDTPDGSGYVFAPYRLAGGRRVVKLVLRDS